MLLLRTAHSDGKFGDGPIKELTLGSPQLINMSQHTIIIFWMKSLAIKQCETQFGPVNMVCQETMRSKTAS